MTVADRCPLCSQRRHTTLRELLWVVRHPRRARHNWKSGSNVADLRTRHAESPSLREEVVTP
jgi:hypothetical protein